MGQYLPFPLLRQREEPPLLKHETSSHSFANETVPSSDRRSQLLIVIPRSTSNHHLVRVRGEADALLSMHTRFHYALVGRWVCGREKSGTIHECAESLDMTSACSVQFSHHICLRNRSEIVNVQSPAGQDRLDVSRHQLVVQVRRDRELCGIVRSDVRSQSQSYLP